MYCSKCGVQNSDSATHCSNCGSILVNTSGQAGIETAPVAATEAKTCGLAVAAFVMGLLCMTCILWPILVLPVVICGVIAMVKISYNKPHLKGTGLAVAGIAIPAVMMVMVPIFGVLAGILMPALSKAKDQAQKVVCMTNMKTLSLAMVEYTEENDDQYPTLPQWCDLLIQEDDVTEESFHCPQDAEGAFSYAVNETLNGMQITQVKNPDRMVIFFEADLGRNGVGGQDDLVLRHGDCSRLGCNIAFADGHVEFVTQDRLDDLLWTEEE